MAARTAGMTVGQGRYRLERELGKGGMGEVWLAHDVANGEPHALKFITGDEAKTPAYQKRLHREARATMAVKHPNVVRVHEVLEEGDGELVLVMEFLRGRSLGERLEQGGALSVAQTVGIMLPVISAVAAAHAVGIVHRDLKPDNIFLVESEDGRTDVRVLDFGVAKVTQLDTGQTTGLTMTGAMLGTPAYMSPEQACGEKNVDAQTDVWALGAIIFECLTGQLPVHGENIGQLIKAIVSGAVRRIEEVAPGVPPELAEAINGCLRVDRTQRWQNVDQLVPVLERFANHTGDIMRADAAAGAALAATQWSPPSQRSGVSSGSPLVQDRALETSPSRQRTSKGRRGAVVLAFGALVACGVGVASFASTRTRPHPHAQHNATRAAVTALTAEPIAHAPPSAVASSTVVDTPTAPPVESVAPESSSRPVPVAEHKPRTKPTGHGALAAAKDGGGAPTTKLQGGVAGEVPF